MLLPLTVTAQAGKAADKSEKDDMLCSLVLLHPIKFLLVTPTFLALSSDWIMNSVRVFASAQRAPLSHIKPIQQKQ